MGNLTTVKLGVGKLKLNGVDFGPDKIEVKINQDCEVNYSTGLIQLPRKTEATLKCKVKWFKGATKLFNGTIARTRRKSRRKILFKKQGQFRRYRVRRCRWWFNNKFSTRYAHQIKVRW